MKDMQNNEGRTPFEDLTNTINCGNCFILMSIDALSLFVVIKLFPTNFETGGQSTSNSREQVDERVQRKREREKARNASMT